MSTINVLLYDYTKTEEGLYTNILVDFYNDQDRETFARSEINTDNNSLSEDFPAMLLIKNLRGDRVLRLGSYYRLDLDLLSEVPGNHNADYNYLISYTFDFENNPRVTSKNLFTSQVNLKSYSVGGVNVDHLNNNILTDYPHNYQLKLKVNDVGQGNNNELRYLTEETEVVDIVFDMGSFNKVNGGDYSTNKALHKLFQPKITEYCNDRPLLVISHLHADHIVGLCAMKDAEIQCFRAAVTPDQVVSNGPKAVYNRLKKLLGANLYTVTNRGSSNDMNEICRKNPVAIFKGDSPDIHHGGITMFVTGGTSTALFTGDCDMWQAFDLLKSQYQLPQNQGLLQKLIVPHHGAQFICAVYPCNVTPEEAYISVGKINRYGHPKKQTINALNRLGYFCLCTKDIKIDITRSI